ncbi:hypothetical protein DYU11_13145 [Fibrisoma montanum]|uniref:DUF4332 domain-containing protein n=1 Tax=Fibrisoma montanum TaxID=2305895 RepID=A0A418MC07_9BACT|nr:hypothetical protein [Fibrisoma montanum]RIV23905.1 hypothetical protein DYU11_13145 [Fibrisoma montanum]
MFDMNPLNLPDAQLQQWIMLFVAGALGFIIGYVSRQEFVRQLETTLVNTERRLDDCQRMPVSVAGNDESLILARIRARAGELNFDRIGLASPSSADNLKLIVGIGPFLERKLNAAGIYTFRQIANFNQQDIDTVNDIIEFFPGRIERDDWVGQAAELHRRTH